MKILILFVASIFLNLINCDEELINNTNLTQRGLDENIETINIDINQDKYYTLNRFQLF